MKKYTPPSYPSKKADLRNEKIMAEFRKFKEGGARVEVAQLFNLDRTPSVIPPIKNLGKSNK